MFTLSRTTHSLHKYPYFHVVFLFFFSLQIVNNSFLLSSFCFSDVSGYLFGCSSCSSV